MPFPNISKPCKTIEDELDHVKLEIVKRMSDNEHEVVEKLKKYETKISELEEEIAQFKEIKENEDTERNKLLENNK